MSTTETPPFTPVDPVALALLAAGASVVLLQPFIPHHEFIHRGDDAYYFFQVAINYPRYGFWTFDGINPTNGVQPLWAWLLTGIAMLGDGVGLSDKMVFARVFAAVTALTHTASVFLLVHLLARTVSFGTAVTAGGALIFSMGTVWVHTWGMENSLYALLLIGSVSYSHLVLAARPTPARAIVFGLLLGLTALARLNAVFFSVFATSAFVLAHYRQLRRRAVLLGAIAAVTAGAVVLPYIAWNRATTGHFAPVSAGVKAIEAAEYRRAHDLDSPISPRFARQVLRENRRALWNFVSGPLGDALWPLGGRVVFHDTRGLGPRVFLPFGVCVALLLMGRGGAGRRLLAARLRAIRPFAYVLAFAIFNGAISIVLYPNQIRYAMTKWWLVEGELVLTVLGAVLVAATVARMLDWSGLFSYHRWFWRVAVALAAVFSVVQAAGFYWDGEYEVRDWNPSWNDHAYRAAMWLRRCAPEDTRVGSWNAGVLGYYAVQPVTNLDGLINSHDLILHLRDRTIAQYIAAQNLQFISDAEASINRAAIRDKLQMREVYREYMPVIKQHYRIYRILPDTRQLSPGLEARAGGPAGCDDRP